MRLVRLGPIGGERPAVMVPGSDNEAFDVSELVDDFDAEFFGNGGMARIAAAIEADGLSRVDVHSGRIGAPFARPHAIYGIGLNYRDHAREVGMDPPAEPIVFNKAPNSLVGPHDDIVLPPGSTSTDWEVELGVVIGRRARYLDSPAEAADHIAGFVAVNDVSERDAQLHRGGQWVKGKSFETFNPAGPFLVTLDEVADPAALRLRLRVNGEVMQDGTTADLVFDPFHLVWYLSQFVVLEPGDLIDTGTPAGVGTGHRPPLHLHSGDLVELEVTGLGGHRSHVR
jgi:2-keto-4-pentenoate hydratase/2-oxohepta-3-ene-1,7-dioic acid hydratase in catechol pathway